ncbi:MAG TPA: amidohydrolase family protein [Pyrinomonadaceae bacterium]|nr:amidohydrolase family protein [Pyrinomonadaceae bacterium]
MSVLLRKMTNIYCARWVLPVASPAVEDGAVAVEGSLIMDVGGRKDIAARFPEARVRDFGEAAILPGLVNAHTHLELTAMRGYLESEEDDFSAWLKKLTLARLERMTQDDLYVSAAWGAVEAVRAGVTCIGDASDAASSSMRAATDVGLRGVIYQETFGPNPAEAQMHFDNLREKVARLREYETELVRVGVSPHAPYTVSAPQLELITEFALAEKLPVMMHAAESKAEELFMLEGRGSFAEGLARRGIVWSAPGISTIQYLARHGVLRARPLLAHCITVDEQDVETIKETGAKVAHCPKSNAKLDHGRAPFAAFVKEGIHVGFGSDSVASNNTCDILEEARFALLTARASEEGKGSAQQLNAELALRVATSGDARALNLETKTGALEKGAQADMAVVALNGAHQTPVYDAHAALIFASSGRDVLMTMVAGREVYSEGRVHTVDEQRLRARIKEIGRKVMGDR